MAIDVIEVVVPGPQGPPGPAGPIGAAGPLRVPLITSTSTSYGYSQNSALDPRINGGMFANYRPILSNGYVYSVTFYCGTAGAGESIDAAIYDSDDQTGLPSGVKASATVDLGATGFKTVVVQQQFSGPFVWLVLSSTSTVAHVARLGLEDRGVTSVQAMTRLNGAGSPLTELNPGFFPAGTFTGVWPATLNVNVAGHGWGLVPSMVVRWS